VLVVETAHLARGQGAGLVEAPNDSKGSDAQVDAPATAAPSPAVPSVKGVARRFITEHQGMRARAYDGVPPAGRKRELLQHPACEELVLDSTPPACPRRSEGEDRFCSDSLHRGRSQRTAISLPHRAVPCPSTYPMFRFICSSSIPEFLALVRVAERTASAAAISFSTTGA